MHVVLFVEVVEAEDLIDCTSLCQLRTVDYNFEELGPNRVCTAIFKKQQCGSRYNPLVAPGVSGPPELCYFRVAWFRFLFSSNAVAQNLSNECPM